MGDNLIEKYLFVAPYPHPTQSSDPGIGLNSESLSIKTESAFGERKTDVVTHIFVLFAEQRIIVVRFVTGHF